MTPSTHSSRRDNPGDRHGVGTGMGREGCLLLFLHVEGELQELDVYGLCTSPNVNYASVKISLKNK